MENYPQIVTQLNENGVSVTTVIDAPWVSVTSLNGMTGDVKVNPIINTFESYYPYPKGSVISYNSSLYIAKQAFTSGNTFNINDWDLVQASADVDWTDVKNKPNFATVATSGSYTDLSNIPANLVQDADYVHTDNNFTSTLLTKLNGIANGAEANVQANWNTTLTTDESFILNKPTSLSQFTYDIINKIYPVGSIYMSATLSTVAQVQSALGGTWVAWGAGKVPVGVDSSDTDFSTTEKTGGEKTHTLTTNELASHTHTYNASSSTTDSHILTEAELPKISGNLGGVHTYGSSAGGHFTGSKENPTGDPTSGSSRHWTSYNFSFGSGNGHTHGITLTSTTSGSRGSGNAHNNLQPYITCYMYKRTA